MICRFKKKYWIVFIILTLSLGGIGGSFQPSRIFLIISFILIIQTKLDYNLKSSTGIGIIICAFWITYGLISLIWSTLPITGLNSELIVMSIGMLSLPVFGAVDKSENTIDIIKYSWVGGATIATLMGIYEILTGNHFAFADEGRVLGGINIEVPFASGLFGNFNNFCAYLTICFPFTLWVFFEINKSLIKIPLSLLILSIITLVLIDGSRTGILVLLIQLLYFIFSYVKVLIKNISIVVLASFLLIFFVPWDTLLLVLNYRLGSTDQDARSIMVTAGLEMLYLTYGFGVGAGSFEYYAMKMNTFDHIINPHNILIEIISQYGIIIFVAFCFWLCHIFIKTIRNNYIEKGAKVAIQILIITIPLIGVMNSNALGYIYWWVVFGSLCTIADSTTNY